MFAWNLAKSAEAVFSRWAMKRLFKFFLKKKLGQFILGDIDLDQLDVQLREGVLQLNDLALNVDYLNDKFCASTPVIVKEGSIGSLSVKMPWKGKGFQVELDELEVVFSLASCSRNKSTDGDKCSGLNPDSDFCPQSDGGDHGYYVTDYTATSSVGDVHEGVKTIAKMVKWFLTKFHVNVKNLIVAFEPYSDDDKVAEGQKILVLRVSETECGSCVSEDANTDSDTRVESFLGLSHFTNFIAFRGAVLELLNMDDVEKQTSCFSPLGSSFSEFFSGHCPSNATTPIVTGSNGEVSGNLKLSIPWKNGSLDIRKVDADISIEPLELRLQPSTIKWLLLLWETYKTLDEVKMHKRSMGSVDLNLSSHFCSSTFVPGSAKVCTDKMIPIHGSFLPASPSLTERESTSGEMLPGSHLITDWVPNSLKENSDDVGQEELDLGASMDQFFECFDGMRSSQSALRSSGMWNWTCSVFSALTAASSLASGSFQITSEQQHVQTSLQATLAGVSIMLSFQDDYESYLYNSKGDQNSKGSNGHLMVAKCDDISIALQVCPQGLSVEGKFKYIEIAEYSCSYNDAVNFYMGECSTESNSATVSVQQLQDEVQGALPPFGSLVQDPVLDKLGVENASDFVFRHMIKIKLLSTSGISRCQIAMSTDSLDGNLFGPSSFSLQLPHFLFWINYWSVHKLLDLLKDIGRSVKKKSQVNECSPVNHRLGSCVEDVKKGCSPDVAKLPSRETFEGNISIPNARIIFCFPFGSSKDGDYLSWNQFIAIDVSAPRTSREGDVQDSCSWSDSNPWKRCPSMATRSIHLKFGDLKVYVVNHSCESDVGISHPGSARRTFYAGNILSISNGSGCHSTVSMLWQEGSVTGSLIAERAKSLAVSQESRSMTKTTPKGSEFASVTSMKDLEDTSSQTREEMILSSSFSLQIRLVLVMVDLTSSEYGNLHNLLNQMIDALLPAGDEMVNTEVASNVSQTSILVECVSVEIVIRPEMNEGVKSSLQSELAGSWHCLTLKVKKLDVLFVSNIGGIGGANFFWLAHGEGKLWGSTTGVPDHEFLLISCSNSTRKRGNGGGSNVLSSRGAGLDIFYLWDPKDFHEFTSINIRCGTIVAVGGRLDWMDSISSFFTLPSHDVEKAGNGYSPEGDINAPCGYTFTLKLIDIGLSYEPHWKNSLMDNCHSESSSSYPFYEEETGVQHVTCLLAASSLTLSRTTIDNSTTNDYKIRVQDVGFLLCQAFENHGGTYSVKYLREMGYIKVAHEALIEAVLRTNCRNGLLWELECSESHIYVETCHDTTYGLLLLAAQLQPLFAPDLEESSVHLQARWNNVNQGRESGKHNDDAGSSIYPPLSTTSQVHASGTDTNDRLGNTGLMDEICEDAFCLNGNKDCQFDSIESRVCVSFDESSIGESCCLTTETPEIVSEDLFCDGSVPPVGTSYLHSGTLPELMESYCLADLRPLSELSLGGQLPSEILRCQSRNFGDTDLVRGSDGWYGDASLSVVENHISETGFEASMSQVSENKLSFECEGSDETVRPTGRILLKNINVSWRMFAGSDWHSHKSGEPSRSVNGRDASSNLEIVLSGIHFQYNFFPVSSVYASKLSLSVQNFDLYDRSNSAPWKRVLGYYRLKGRPRESSSKALKLELEAVRPDPQIPLEEYRLHIALLPLLLQLHQSQLDFLTAFFGSKSLLPDQTSDHTQNSGGARPSVPNNLTGQRIVVDEALLPYFQKFDVRPIILRVDYSPQHVDISALGSGNYVELANLVPWKGVELELKHVHAAGVYGWGNVCEIIIGEWLEDISQNQIHKVLQGLPAIRSLVAVGTGAAKLVSLPVASYKKDRRLLKGIQRGSIAFLRSISLEAVGLGVHLAAGAHDILLQAEYVLAKKIPSPVSRPVKGNTKTNIRCNQPKNAQQGIQQAYESISDGLGRSASALVQTPLKKYQRGASAGSALATAVRGVPAAAIAPVSACASAAHYTLLGIRNGLDPEHKKESMDKYLGPTQPHG